MVLGSISKGPLSRQLCNLKWSFILSNYFFPSNLRYLTFSVEAKNCCLKDRPWLINPRTGLTILLMERQKNTDTLSMDAIAYCHIDSH